MNSLARSFCTVGFLTLLASAPLTARADYQQRFSLGLGVWHTNNTTDFEVGAEYEHRVDPAIGLGLGGNYIFSNPAIGLLAAPTVYLHPFGTEFYVSASPLFEFGSGIDTKTGVRFGTRLPLPLGAITIVPSLNVDLINSRTNYIFGLGIQI